ncbi:hypothetical protein V0R50_17685 [Pseudomonas sp. 148P]|uniref:Uncharacterized protein n=1 Tax=Pseudomonas ulcerans TaxID=3115852 RepID=A0ABU7HU52_9PSED|nr:MULTISPECIES: hypothetical protein [unclassified Pseudomonas]MEE1925689.1 hypothetical protein [Pseudomonas sp. 147P]MEE1935064.1 hypothetical protein [Pseudomonas sp. 148P]
MWSQSGYRGLVRASGWYDLLITAAFVTPWSLMALHGLLRQLSAQWGLAGDLPDFAPMHVLMANLMGSIVCVWSVLRIRDPQAQFGRYDAVGRLLFALWQGYALAQGASQLLGGILLMELFWAVLQLWPVRSADQKTINSAA